MAAKKQKTVTRYADGSVDAEEFLDALLGPLTFGGMLRAIREGEEESQSVFGAKLGLNAAKMSDVELGRRAIGPSRAAEWARKLGYSEEQFVRLAVQQQLEGEGLLYEVTLKSRSPKSKARKSA